MSAMAAWGRRRISTTWRRPSTRWRAGRKPRYGCPPSCDHPHLVPTGDQVLAASGDPTGACTAEEDLGLLVALGRHGLEFGGRLGQLHPDDVGAAQGDHHTEVAFRD